MDVRILSFMAVALKRICSSFSEFIKETRELPGNALVNITNWHLFMGNGNAFNYSEIFKYLVFEKEMYFLR